MAFNEEEYRIIDQVKEIINSRIVISCTACRYCVDGCPKHIPIPQYFSLYNNQARFELLPAHMNYHMNLAEQYNKASECIDCKQCEQHCPQHIEITKWLKEVSKTFEE